MYSDQQILGTIIAVMSLTLLLLLLFGGLLHRKP